MKKIILLTLGFILTIQIGAFLTEKVKALVAESLNYKSTYIPCWGRSRYYNEDIGNAFDSARELYENNLTQFKNSPERALLMKKSEKNHAFIELSGILFTSLVSIFGLGLFFSLRRKSSTMQTKDWIGALLGLFFMREVVLNAFNLIFGMITCDEAYLWTYFNLPIFPSIWVFTTLGMVLFFFILYKIPRDSRILFLSSGFIGTCLGLYLWLFYVSKILF